jgi:23S rRNA C2498 (ribose-2'-O)-methylase RlmM
LNVYPKKITEEIVDIVIEKTDKLRPTKFDHILAILRYVDQKTGTVTHKIGFSPAASGLDHVMALTRLDDESHVSRAFYKIEEACERCGVQEWPQPSWNALDIGASPGGWSLYLSQVVGTVYAVDPAELTVKKDNIVHLKGQLLHMLPQLESVKLHLVVCDMNNDPSVALECLKSVEHKLEIGGRIIWTLKYQKRATANIDKRLVNDTNIFKQLLPSCDVVRTMHMVSNHHERTLVAVKTRPSSSE